jgi:hypothetical protein
MKKMRKKKGYVFKDYRLGLFVYHYTMLVISKNLQLQIMPRYNSWKVQYILLYSEHEKWMETIGISSDPNGLLEWP